MSSSPKLVIIACGALAREVRAVVEQNGLHGIELACLPAKLHNRPELIAEAVRRKIARLRPLGAPIFCAYGDCGTGGALDRVLAETGAEPIGKVVIGTVKGDIHDIGKNLVCMMMEGTGFEVIDLGVNNSVEKYLAAIDQHQPDIVGMSALLTTTMPYMKVVIDTLKEKGMRNDYIVLVGGAPVNESFAMSVGADAYCRDAAVAVETAKSLLAKRQGSAQARGLA